MTISLPPLHPGSTFTNSTGEEEGRVRVHGFVKLECIRVCDRDGTAVGIVRFPAAIVRGRASTRRRGCKYPKKAKDGYQEGYCNVEIFGTAVRTQPRRY